jgi:hypothetical protein
MDVDGLHKERTEALTSEGWFEGPHGVEAAYLLVEITAEFNQCQSTGHGEFIRARKKK